MKIVIDCRYLGMSGIGRFLEGILENLPPSNEYYFLGKKDKISALVSSNNIIEDNTSPFSVKGLFINKSVNKYDIFFTPNFIVPFNVRIKIYSVIHDIIFLDYKESCNSYFDFLVKRFLIKRACKVSTKLFTVSKFTKNRIIMEIPKIKVNPIVIYNGITKNLVKFKESLKEPILKIDKQLIFVGNIKKHKGLETLAKAMNQLSNYELYIVGKKDGFRTKDEHLSKYLECKNIHFTGRIADDDLYKLILSSSFLIQPSYYEGFGLPPLEALYLGTKPIISDIEVFKEVYSDFDVTYFKVGDSTSLVDAIKTSDSNVKVDSDVLSQRYSFAKSASTIFGE